MRAGLLALALVAGCNRDLDQLVFVCRVDADCVDPGLVCNPAAGACVAAIEVCNADELIAAATSTAEDVAYVLSCDRYEVPPLTFAAARVLVTGDGAGDPPVIHVAAIDPDAPARAAITIEADEVALRDLDIEAAWPSTPDPQDGKPRNTTAAGVLVARPDGVPVERTVIADVSIHGVVAHVGNYRQTDDQSAAGGTAAGIRLEHVRTCIIDRATIYSITGGRGGGAQPPLSHGRGGLAAGILALDAQDCDMLDNDVSLVTGGDGGDNGGAAPGVPATGGLAAGIYLGAVDKTASYNNQLERNQLASLQGGNGTTHRDFAGPPQIAAGVYLEPTSRANHVAMSNQISALSGEREPIIYLYGERNGVVLADVVPADLTAQVNPTNWGKIAVYQSRAIDASGIEVGGTTGETGQTGEPGEPGCDGGAGVAIAFDECVDCRAVDVGVKGVIGGVGGWASLKVGTSPHSGRGGDAIGVLVTGGGPDVPVGVIDLGDNVPGAPGRALVVPDLLGLPGEWRPTASAWPEPRPPACHAAP